MIFFHFRSGQKLRNSLQSVAVLCIIVGCYYSRVCIKRDTRGRSTIPTRHNTGYCALSHNYHKEDCIVSNIYITGKALSKENSMQTFDAHCHVI